LVQLQLSRRLLARSRILSTKTAGKIPTKGVWVSRQYNATHIISIPGNWLIGGDLAVLMTAERHFLLEVQSTRARFLTCEMWIDKAAVANMISPRSLRSPWIGTEILFRYCDAFFAAGRAKDTTLASFSFALTSTWPGAVTDTGEQGRSCCLHDRPQRRNPDLVAAR
jgi:hypothetical protein